MKLWTNSFSRKHQTRTLLHNQTRTQLSERMDPVTEKMDMSLSSKRDLENANTGDTMCGNNLETDAICEEDLTAEIQGQKRQKIDDGVKVTFCNPCLVKHFYVVRKVVAFYLCYICELYLCENCFKEHKSHDIMTVLVEESARKRTQVRLLDRLRNDMYRNELFYTRNVSVCDRVNVKHRLDMLDCRITGLCGLDNKGWVACDIFNCCIKIFDLGTNTLRRYIRFGSTPGNVAEIAVKPKLDIQDLESKKAPVLLAVTFPMKREILLIDVGTKPATENKRIQLDKKCWSLEFNDGKMYTVCDEDPEDMINSLCSVYVVSTAGDILQIIDTDIYAIPDFAVGTNRMYLSDFRKDKIQCVDFEGRILGEITIDGSKPAGVCLDIDRIVYACSFDHNKIYQLSCDLDRHEVLLEQARGYVEWPGSLCCYRDKLFVSNLAPSLQNIVNVVRLV